MVNVGKYTIHGSYGYTSWKIKMEPKNGWQMICLFKWVIFRFHVDFQRVVAPETRTEPAKLTFLER